MSRARWSTVRARTAAAVCAASLLAVCGPAFAGGPHGADDVAEVRPTAVHGLPDEPGVQFRPRPDVSWPPEVSAQSWVVADAGSGTILAAKDAHRRLPPASTLKTLFAVTVLPKFSPETVHTVSEAELAGIEAGSALVGIKEDMDYSVADLWRGVFLNSGSDAVRVLASMNGGWAETVADMQATAERLGAHDTQVESADGFDIEGQHSSAYDLSLFARAGLADREFVDFASTKTARFPEDGGPLAFGIQNTNRLLVGSHGVEPYPGLIGVKNGYTSAAGNTLIAAARRDGRTLLVTVMKPRSGAGNAVYEEARALLDWGFHAAPRAEPVGTLAADAPAEESDKPYAGARRTGRRQPAAVPRKTAAPRGSAALRTTTEAQDSGSNAPYVWGFAAVTVALVGLGAGRWRRRRRKQGAAGGESG
ncbi:D-alanyl-D-alanine carboxypeptidase [Streptomyces kasugaensis]|uniref:D-alanyl-D-alanine carboxypeptidase n=1 Tax=Streptomyces kasugaensis TaxID=1946 RepID=A0A4Q9HM37_STRKA|nr:D-alanyl-D-alanine carboxypeptidase [Streptomyces kasugaensis]TBO55864.1 D-alanyl-D-alanine carboxypeptidase [Streptomyces kasugaensis]